MKKIVALVLALVMLTGCALAAVSPSITVEALKTESKVESSTIEVTLAEDNDAELETYIEEKYGEKEPGQSVLDFVADEVKAELETKLAEAPKAAEGKKNEVVLVGVTKKVPEPKKEDVKEDSVVEVNHGVVAGEAPKAVYAVLTITAEDGTVIFLYPEVVVDEEGNVVVVYGYDELTKLANASDSVLEIFSVVEVADTAA